MAPRRILVGCATAGALMAALAIVASVMTFVRLSATVPLPGVASMIDEETHGFAVLSVRADDPWVEALIEQADPKRRDRADLLPLEIVWVAFDTSDGSDGHALRLAVSPRGRLIASLIDLALWHAGHSGDRNVSRTEHAGEGITAFPGSPVPGLLFVRDTSIVWASTPASARSAVEALAGGVEAAASPLLDREPESSGAILRGVLRNIEDSMVRTLRAIPGEALDVDDEQLEGVEGVSFRFVTTSPDDGAGSIEIDFRPETSGEAIRRVSRVFRERIAGLSTSELVLETAERLEERRAIISVRATGLLSLHPWILSAPERLREAFRQFEIGRAEEKG